MYKMKQAMNPKRNSKKKKNNTMTQEETDSESDELLQRQRSEEAISKHIERHGGRGRSKPCSEKGQSPKLPGH